MRSCQAPVFFKNLVGGSTPPQQKGGCAHYVIAQSWLRGSQKVVKKYQTYLSSQCITQNLFLNCYSANWWGHKLQDLISILSNGWQREKEAMREIQKFEYLENNKKLLDKIKSVFLNFLICCKINMQYLLDEICQFSFVLKVTTALK